ncbi:heterokaryon incompatibility protein-domain-containing protein [Aspergillus minisclerotigenes]|uniref:Heterokaryon incompatibility protein-domain-containing protein n=1 Tax=Aspergillus minisclerotigenes TaxID=656917 RepID=A0A5N6IPR0_9EURO|nr:heterokaryon incompatibility protein-domain-containing protein [Aspergillus minisclerotigenes]
MRNNPPPPNLLLPPLLNESQQSMKRAPGFERANALQILAFEEEPDGRALSYVWGRSKHSQPIYLNGSPVYITRHLRRALRQLRSDSEAVCLWVDAVCINQSDDEEKTEQVKMMGKIYAQSQEVVVYLGDAFAPSFSQSFNHPSDTSDAIADTITPHECYSTAALDEKDTGLVWRRQMSYKDGSYLFCFIQLLADGVDMNSFMVDKDQGSLDEVMEALRLFLSAVKWWKRVWVIQEVVIASRIMILYGSMIAPWEMFVQAANRVLGNSQMQISSLAVNDTKILLEFSRRILSIESIRARWQSPEQITLLQLLHQFSGREATDPRDKVYALLGLAKDKPTVEPNYAASERDVFVGTALDIISRSKSLDVLTGDFTMKNNHALPSWVPDWSSPFEASIQSRVESVKHYTACNNSTMYVQLEASEEVSSAYQNCYIAPSRYREVIEKSYGSWGGHMCLRVHEQGRISLPALSVEPIMVVGETMWSDAVLISTISSWLAMIAEYSFLLEKLIPREDFESTMWERVRSSHSRSNIEVLGKPGIPGSPDVHFGDHTKKYADLQEAGTRWKAQTSNWYQKAEAWQDAYSAFWEQLKESESLLRGDHSSRWRIASQDYDIICQSWARVQLTWEKSRKACQEFLYFTGAFGWRTISIFREWHENMQFLDSAILAWQSTQTCSQHSLQACEQEIRRWMEIEKNLVNWSMENISRRYNFIERLLLGRLKSTASENVHTGERPLSCLTRHDWQCFAEECAEFADRSLDQALPWKVLVDAQKKVWATEGSLGRFFQDLAEATAHISEQDLYTYITEWRCQLEEWELTTKKLKEEGLQNCTEAVEAAQKALWTICSSEEDRARLKSLIVEVGREKFAIKHLNYKLGMESLVVVLV